MIKFWINLIVIAVVAALGLAVGAANDSPVYFDFLVVKAEVSLASVLVVGVIIGFILGFLGAVLMVLRFWNHARQARSALAKLKKETEQKEKSLPVAAAQ